MLGIAALALAMRLTPLGIIPPLLRRLAGMPVLVVVVIGACLGLLWLVRWRYTLARTGEAYVHADRVVIVLRDVTAFDDASGDVLLLHLASGPPAAVPTGGEDRTVLLAALDAAGLRRLDAGPRPLAPLPLPALVVTGPRGLLELAALPLSIALAITIAVSLWGSFLLFGLPVAALMWLAWREPGFGTARLLDDRVELVVWSAMIPRPAAIAWDDVVGWAVGSPNHLLLQLRAGRLREAFKPGVPLPTPDAPARAALVAQLTARGIPRVA